MLKGKRILAFVLMVVMLLSLLPVFALAEEVSTEGRTNLVTNGSFEDGFSVTVGSNTKNWAVSSNNYGTKGTISNEKYRTGAQSVKVGDQIKTGTAASNKWISYTMTGADVGLIPGHTYRFVAYSMMGDAASVPQMRIVATHTETKKVDTNTGDIGTSDSNNWVKHEIEYVAPADITSIVIYLRNYTNTDGSYCYFDDFAIYDMDEKLYTVIWKNDDGTVLETDNNVPAGAVPEYNGATPVKDSKNGLDYFFNGWSPEVAAVTGDVTYTAQYESGKVVLSNGYEDGEDDSKISAKAVYSAEQKRSGSLSAKVNYAGTNISSKWISYTLSIEGGNLIPGHKYRFVAYSMMGDADSVPQMRMVASHTTTKKVDQNTDTLGTSFSDEWVMLEMEYETPNDVESITIYLRNYSATDGSYCYFDDFAVYDLSAEAPAEKFVLNGANVNLGNDLDMKFFIKPTDLTEGETYNAKMVRTYADGSTDTQEETVSKVYSDGDYYVSYKGLAAKEMGDKIAVTIYDSEGNAVSQVWNDSVKDYAIRALAKYSDDSNTVDMIKDLLNYGAAAQTAFDYDAQNPVNADVDKAVPEVTGTDVSASNDRAYWNGAELRLQSDITFKAFFKSDKVTRDMTAEVSFTNYKNAPVSYTVAGTAFGQDTNDTDLYVPVTGLVIGDTDTVITIVIKDAEGNEVVTVTDSIASYVVRYNSLANADADFVALNKAIMALGASVEAAL